MKKRKRFLAIFMTTILVLTPIDGKVITAAQNDQSNSDENINITKLHTKVLTDQIKNNLEDKNTAYSKNNLKETYKDTDIVDVIVELNDNSLLQKYNESSTLSKNKSFEEYVVTSDANLVTNRLLQTQDNVIQKIKSLDSTSNITKIYNYTTVLNGFSIKIKYGLLKNIQNMKEVKTAFVAPTYVIEPTLTNSVPYIGADKTWNNAGFKGEGMVVAVVDTGLDTSHEVFQKNPKSPRVSKEDIDKIINSGNLSSVKDQPITSSDVYYSAKIPYTYDYADHDTNVSGGDSHGTHVAGIVAASGLTTPTEDGDEVQNGILGVAPEAQLMILKVFSDKESGASDTNILAALDDAVKLGTDVINMSLGSGSGFTEEGNEVTQEVYDNIKDAGINLVCSAGNDHSMSNANNLGGKSLTQNPDTSVVGSPSTYDAALSVASVKNAGSLLEEIVANGKGITYIDNANKGQKLTDVLNGSYDYVPVGVGTADDYKKVDVKGKIALIQRGSISFADKENNAYQAGAIAAVIYNNKAGTISMAIDNYDIPTVSVTQDDGLYLLNLEDKKIVVSKENSVDVSGTASDFSSWGVTPDLKLKPEIAAPGEGIYSSVPGGYETMSGTSMASPHIAGASALVKEYINKIYGNSKTNEEKAVLTNQIMMSTATPMKDLNTGLPFSPRKQGAGMVNVYSAVSTGAYLYVDGDDKTKVELGDDVAKRGSYSFSFHVKNVSEHPISYNLNTITETEGVNNQQYIAESPYALSPEIDVQADGANLSEDNVLTVDANNDAIVHMTITLSDNDKSYLDTNFRNGEFVEGFVQLDASDDVDLSIPYMGFYGDWTKAPIMDSSSLYDGGQYSQTSSEAYNSVLGIIDSVLGENLFAYLNDVSLPIDKNKIAISPNGDGLYDSVDAVKTSLLRNVKNLDYRVTDDVGNIYYQYNSKYETKSYYYANGGYILYALNSNPWAGTDVSENILQNNSTYTYKITGQLDYDDHISNNAKASWEFPVTIDTEEPSIVDTNMYRKNGKTYLDVDVTDNQYVAGVSLYSSDGDKLLDEITTDYLNEDTKADTTKVTFDITDHLSESFGVSVIDYAVNESDYVLNYDVESISLDKTSLEMFVGDKATLSVTSNPDIHPFITWISSDSSIASVDNGVVSALKSGTVEITAKTRFGKSASCVITINDVMPTVAPTTIPSTGPTTDPTIQPTTEPTVVPTTEPTVAPTTEPTVVPTTEPTVQPTTEPTVAPTTEPTVKPTIEPTVQPTTEPTVKPTTEPTVKPTTEPTVKPTTEPTVKPTTEPTVKPTTIPTTNPTIVPTANPTVVPTVAPTAKPTLTPTPTASESPSAADLIKKVKVSLSTEQPIVVGDTSKVIVKLPDIPDNYKVSIRYKFNNKSIASVDSNGKVVAKRAGKTVLYVTISIGNVTKTIKLKVTVVAPYINFIKSIKTIKLGNEFQFEAVAYGIEGNIIWSVSDSKVASIDKNTGLFKAKKSGAVYVIVTLGDYIKKIKVTIE